MKKITIIGIILSAFILMSTHCISAQQQILLSKSEEFINDFNQKKVEVKEISPLLSSYINKININYEKIKEYLIRNIDDDCNCNQEGLNSDNTEPKLIGPVSCISVYILVIICAVGWACALVSGNSDLADDAYDLMNNLFSVLKDHCEYLLRFLV